MNQDLFPRSRYLPELTEPDRLTDQGDEHGGFETAEQDRTLFGYTIHSLSYNSYQQTV